MAELTAGHRAPDLKITGLDGQEFDLQSFKGQPVLLNFFKSTCPWCQVEMPRLAKVFSHLKTMGIDVPVQGVVVGSDTPESAIRFAQNANLTIPLAVDADKTARVNFGLVRVPTLVLVDV